MSDLPGYESGPSGLLELFGIEGDCCPSCVEDEELGYTPMPWITLPDGREVSVCCRHVREVADAVASKKDSEPS